MASVMSQVAVPTIQAPSGAGAGFLNIARQSFSDVGQAAEKALAARLEAERQAEEKAYQRGRDARADKIVDDRLAKEAKSEKMYADMVKAEAGREANIELANKGRYNEMAGESPEAFAARMAKMSDEDMKAGIYGGAKEYLAKADMAGVDPKTFETYRTTIENRAIQEDKDKRDQLTKALDWDKEVAFKEKQDKTKFDQLKELEGIRHSNDMKKLNRQLRSDKTKTEKLSLGEQEYADKVAGMMQYLKDKKIPFGKNTSPLELERLYNKTIKESDEEAKPINLSKAGGSREWFTWEDSSLLEGSDVSDLTTRLKNLNWTNRDIQAAIDSGTTKDGLVDESKVYSALRSTGRAK